jgi:hypothetical protein
MHEIDTGFFNRKVNALVLGGHLETQIRLKGSGLKLKRMQAHRSLKMNANQSPK